MWKPASPPGVSGSCQPNLSASPASPARFWSVSQPQPKYTKRQAGRRASKKQAGGLWLCHPSGPVDCCRLLTKCRFNGQKGVRIGGRCGVSGEESSQAPAHASSSSLSLPYVLLPPPWGSIPFASGCVCSSSQSIHPNLTLYYRAGITKFITKT